MPATIDAQVILGRPILATLGCYVDVRKGQITFKVEGRYAVFCHTKEDVVSPSSSLLDTLSLSPEIDMKDVLDCEDRPDYDWISFENPDQRYIKVEFAAPIPPNMPKAKVFVANESAMSYYCRLAQAVLFMPLIEGSNADFDLGVEQVDHCPPDRLRMHFVLYADNALWHCVMKTKDLQPNF